MATSHTIKVTDVSDEFLSLLDDRVRNQDTNGRSEYIRDLIRLEELREEIYQETHPRPVKMRLPQGSLLLCQ